MTKLRLLLLGCFLSQFSFGQLNFSIRAGGSIGTTVKLIRDQKQKIGWFTGIASNIPLNKKLSIAPELLYAAKGYRYNDLSGGKIVAMRLNYLNLPILLRYRFDTKTYMLGGAELGYLLNAALMFNDSKFNATSSFPQRYDVGLAIGMQHDILPWLGIEARYVYGVKGFYQTDAVGQRRGLGNAKNRVFQLGINYYLFKKNNTPSTVSPKQSI